MMFEFSKPFKIIKFIQVLACLGVTFATILIQNAVAQPTAVVPQNMIYPGETISSDMVKLVDVINPNLKPGYAKVIAQVDGLVTTKTLLPGRTIPVSALRQAYLVERGETVKLVYSANGIILTAQAIALQNGALGEMVRARNVDSGLTILATIMADGNLKASIQ